MAEWLERFRGPATAVLLCACVFGIALWWERRPTPSNLVVSAPTTAAGVTQRWLVVDVGGAVNKPGIYYLPEGSRVADAVDEAGGVAANADLARLNRAVRLRDEQQVRVPFLQAASQDAPSWANSTSTTSPPQRQGSSSPAALVNINTASLAQLDTLPGIGPVTAQRIVDYRETKGSFKRTDELREAKLVNSATFEKIKELIEAN